MEIAALVIGSISLLIIAAGLLTLRTALQVIHAAVNSNMTRALDEITQLHKDVADLIRQRDRVQTAAHTTTRQRRK